MQALTPNAWQQSERMACQAFKFPGPGRVTGEPEMII
jgi:hypothetical protein